MKVLSICQETFLFLITNKFSKWSNSRTLTSLSCLLILCSKNTVQFMVNDNFIYLSFRLQVGSFDIPFFGTVKTTHKPSQCNKSVQVGSFIPTNSLRTPIEDWRTNSITLTTFTLKIYCLLCTQLIIDHRHPCQIQQIVILRSTWSVVARILVQKVPLGELLLM